MDSTHPRKNTTGHTFGIAIGLPALSVAAASRMPILAYWKTRGLAQPIRLLLNYIGQDFEDVKFEMGDGPEFSKEVWLSKKFTFGLDFPNIPLYVDGDVKISQSNAIIMYLGRKHNLVGTTEAERIMVDILLNHYMDLRVSIDNVTYSPDYEETKTGLFDSMKITQLPLLEARLSKANTWFIGETVPPAEVLIIGCGRHTEVPVTVEIKTI